MSRQLRNPPSAAGRAMVAERFPLARFVERWNEVLAAA